MKKPAVTKKASNDSKHTANASKVVIGGKGVHGMPLMSAAAAKAKH